MSYPILSIAKSSYKIKADDGQVVSYAASGEPKIKILSDKARYTISFTHVRLTQADIDILSNHYEGNKFTSFDFIDPDSGYTYSCKYLAQPNETNFRGNVRDLEVQIIGHRK